MKAFNRLQGVALMVLGTVASVPAFAAYDTAAVTTEITAAATAIGVIGAAVVAGPRVIRAAWSWIKGTVR